MGKKKKKKKMKLEFERTFDLCARVLLVIMRCFSSTPQASLSAIDTTIKIHDLLSDCLKDDLGHVQIWFVIKVALIDGMTKL